MVIVIWKSILKRRRWRVESNPKLQEIIDDTAQQLETFSAKELFAEVQSKAYGETESNYTRTLRDFTKGSLVRYMMLSDNYYSSKNYYTTGASNIAYWMWMG